MGLSMIVLLLLVGVIVFGLLGTLAAVYLRGSRGDEDVPRSRGEIIAVIAVVLAALVCLVGPVVVIIGVYFFGFSP